jgi:DNA-binding transcriptional regulator LsrR (DeoR family)
VSRVIAATNFGAVGPVHMVTLTGGVDGYLQTILSSKSEGVTEPEATTTRIIPWPITASTPPLAAALKAEPTIQQALKEACDDEQAIVCWGRPPPTRLWYRWDTLRRPICDSCATRASRGTSSASSSMPAAR